MSCLQARATRLGAPLRRLASAPPARYASASAPTPSASPSSSKLDVKPQAPLAPEKLRTLVSLYHRSVGFVTRENLSDAIDDAFIRRPAQHIAFRTQSPETPLGSLRDERVRRDRLPRFSRANRAVPKSDGKDVKNGDVWSERRSARELRVLQTLYGVEGRGLPGYDALKEEEARVKEEWRQEREAAYE